MDEVIQPTEADWLLTGQAYNMKTYLYEQMLYALATFLMAAKLFPHMVGQPMLGEDEAKELGLKQAQIGVPPEFMMGNAYEIVPKLEEIYRIGYDLQKDHWPDEGDEWFTDAAKYATFLWL